MSKERRYNEKEIAAIFEQAAKDFDVAQQKVQSGEGLTLKEIEGIAKEVGISPEFVQRAASKVELKQRSPRDKKIAGLPFQIARLVQLPASFGDQEWDRLIADLHDVYGVVGTIQETRQGRGRSWATENVQVYLEPTGSSQRLRVISTNGGGTLLLLFGSIFFMVSLMFMVILMTKGKFMTEMDDTAIMFIFSFLGLGTAGWGASRLPKWHKREEQRLDMIVSRVLSSHQRESNLELDPAVDERRVSLDEADVYHETSTSENRSKSKA